MIKGKDNFRKNMQPMVAFGGPSTTTSTAPSPTINVNTANNSTSAAKSNRRIKQGRIDVDYDQSCLVVNFEVELVEMDDNGRVLEVVERMPEVLRIKIKLLTQDKNLAQMAEDIVNKCKKIHPSRVEEVEQLLIQLRRYQQANEKKFLEEPAPPANPKITNGPTLNLNLYDDEKPQERHNDKPKERSRNEQQEPQLPPSRMDDLDNYLDMLYTVSSKSDKDKDHAMKQQILGTAMILQLCRDVANLEHLIQNGTLMGALTRVLQDEHKKSDELTYNILRIFLAFSNFSEMHTIITNYKIGALTMKVIEFELKRTEVREQERIQNEMSLEEELNKLRKSSSGPDNQTAVQEFIESMKKSKAKEATKAAQIQRKQDKVLFVCFYILINIAEDVSVERKMIKKDLINHLLSTLELCSVDLLSLVLSFIKKLSVFEENKDLLKESNIVQKCMKYLNCTSPILVNAVLRLLFNLSFDQEVRDQLLKAGIIPKLVILLKTPSYRGKTIKLLYHLSIDDRCKSMITYTEAMPLLMGMIVNFPQPQLTKELAAVVVNLSLNPKNVEQMISSRGLNHLMDRLDNTKDPLLLKIIRNISVWTYNQQRELENPDVQYRLRGLWSPFIKILLKMINERESHDVLIEVFGCLANLTTNDLPNTLPWAKALKEYNLLSIIAKLLVPGMAQNDLLLEIIMLLGTAASEPQACDLISASSIIGLMYQLWKDKSDDTEVQLQLLYCFYKLILHDKSRDEVLYSTRIVVDIIDCLTHRTLAVKLLAEKFCEVVVEYDRSSSGELGQLGLQIRKKRFESYNSGWISASGVVVDTGLNNNMSYADDKFNEGSWQQGAKSVPMDSTAYSSRNSALNSFDQDNYYAASESKAYNYRDFNDSGSEKGDDSWRGSPNYH